ncbi:MAG: hypothetical protein EZS28_006862 [Streblomastix strix]|uniref:Uncharacterized protein n=1 Tax=Streblomastix strix TaxID=222440 RepID=A0A5J4WRS1_9EUKA|nr:MAG: hypothetical protein EZS28_006862 [Streblomastix strix]
MSTNTPLHNVSGSNGFGGIGCRTKLQAATDENGHLNHQAIDFIGNKNNNEQISNNRTEGNENKQGSNNETQHEQDNGNTKIKVISSLQTTYFQQKLGNPNISYSKGQPPLITTPPESGLGKGKVVLPKHRIEQINDHDTRSKTGLSRSVLDKSFRSSEARANSDTPNHFTSHYDQRKKSDIAQVIEDKSAKRTKGYKTSAGSKKQKQ